MNNADQTPQKAIILWLTGTRLSDIRSLPDVQALIERGAMVELAPSPITGPQSQLYQVLSGRSPASFGFFDELVPRNYAVVRESTGRGPTPNLLPDLLRTVGWTTRYEESQVSELVSLLQDWTQSASDEKACLIVKCVIGTQLPDLAQVLQIAQTWVGDSGLLALFSETQPSPVKQYVNVNNFLADMGVIERDEQSGQINWINSLAYFAGYGQLWINLRGRDVHGVVHPQDEYEDVRSSLIRAMPNKLRDSHTGEPVIEHIYRKEELYVGDYLFCAPDLVVVFQPGYAPSPRSTCIEFDETTITTPASGQTAVAGMHPSLLKGYLVASAPSLKANVFAPETVPLTAVVPTVLHALGVEYVGMESLAVSTLFAPYYLEQHPIRSSTQNQELSEEDEELIIGHLRDLGYV